MDDVSYYLGLHPLGALAIVVSTVLLYVAFGALLRWSGPRLLASPSSFDLAIVTVLGAIVGRSILGQVPTLSGGLLALAVLFGLEALTGRLRRSPVLGGRGGDRAVAIWVAGTPEPGPMQRHHLDEAALWAALRAAGVARPDDAALVVLERTGRYSVLRSDAPVDPRALTGVRGGEGVYRRLVAAGLAAPSD